MSSLSESSVLAGAAGVSTGYTIDQSIRFNPSDNTYMHRTQDTADSKRKLSLSWWMKRGSSFGTELCLFAAGASSRFMARMHSDNKMTLRLTNGTTEKTMTTDMVFRDPSAWYHCLWVADCTGGVSSDFSVLYVNGARVTMTGTQPSADTDFAGYGDGSTFSISTNSHSLSSQEWDGYLAEMVLIDNQALDPSSFGEYNESNIWIPKDVSGLTFGTNGFYVDGRDSSDLADDESGNGNDFSTNGLAANDQRTDSPTNNTCVMNSIVPGSATFANGNLDLTYSASAWTAARGTVAIPNNSGIYYYEAKVISHAIYLSFGWGDANMGPNQNNNPATPKFYVYSDYSGKYYSSTDDGTIGDGFTNNDVIGLWYDSGSTTNNLKFYRNGTLQATKSFDFSDVTHVAPVTQFYSSNSVEYRFDSAYWTNAPAGITSLNAITTNNIGS